MEETMLSTFELLHRLGITATYGGYYYTAYSVALAKGQPERLLLVTKWLYPDVARQYGTTWRCVERSIRTVISLAWERNPKLLSSLSGYPMDKKPSVGQFISILMYNLSGAKVA